MAILNRDLDGSQQRDWITWNSQGLSFGASYGAPGGLGAGGVGTGITLFLSGPMPYPYVLQSVNGMAVGTSGAPQLAFSILRPIASAAMTAIPVSISNMVICSGQSFLGFGASAVGFLGYSGLAATGSTLLLGQRGDMIIASTAVANTACTVLTVNLVVQKIQDTLSMDGV
jgi:hypothetical protein